MTPPLTPSRPSQTTTLGGGIRTSQPQSIRMRRPLQNAQQQDAGLCSPMNAPEPPPQLRPRGSKMSLFHLFSRPKVEKQRGYAEQGLAAPQPVREAAASKPEFILNVQHANAGPPRSANVLSLHSTAPRPLSRDVKFKDLPQPPQRDRNRRPWIYPPLFQAYAQSTKDGLAEMSVAAPGTVLSKSKGAKGKGLHLPAETAPRYSADSFRSDETKRTSRTSIKHLAKGSDTRVDFPKKIFVLVTSGYLLQYADSGPSDRLPERVLQLGKDSAAFACDLIPGKHYVLQISQAVNAQGVVVANSGSIFSKLGIRSAAIKRQASNFLLVLPNADEMDSWLVAVRQEIEALGGKKTESDVSCRSRNGEYVSTQASPEKNPSHGHPYQVRRDVSRASRVPTGAMMDVPAQPQRAAPRKPPQPDKEPKEERKNSLEEIEDEASKSPTKLSPAKNRMSRARSPSDAQSVSSSTAVSVDQRRLDNLRRNSKHLSRMSSGTSLTSPRDSLADSSPSDWSNKASLESQDSIQAKPTYRHLFAYGTVRRRSAMPMPTTQEVYSKSASDLTLQTQNRTSLRSAADYADSPTAGRSSPLPALGPSPRKRQSVLTAHPTLQDKKDAQPKHDSKLGTPPTLTENAGRPESFVGDLPPASMWSTNFSPNLRASTMHHSSAQQLPQRPSYTPASRTAELFRPRRYSGQSFSLPLKINPSTPANRPPSRNSNKRFSTVVSDTQLAASEPVIHTLEAKVDPKHHRLSISPRPSPKPKISPKPPSRASSQRLSLFPTTPTTSHPLSQADPLRRSPSTTVIPQSYASAQPNGQTLRRPTSMQIRTDRAPFLSSVRNNNPTAGAPGKSFAAPIRGLKPSRSAVNLGMSTLTEASSPTDPFSTKSISDTTTAAPTAQSAAEASDKPTPLPFRAAWPSPSLSLPSSRGSSHTQQTKGLRGFKTRASLPALDLGIPVVGLGPPAPPPSAPLPAPPPVGVGSRPTSPLPGTAAGMRGMGAANGLGIHVGS